MFLTLITGCGTDEHFDRRGGGAYFPLQRGTFHVYDVKEVRYNGSGQPLESRYQLLTEVTDSFPSEGGYRYVIHRSMRQTEAETWQALDTWSVRKDDHQVVVTEGNTPYVKIRFPLKEGNTWDGNVFNSQGADDYTLRDVEAPASFGGASFEKTITVEQEINDDKIVFRDERKEVYAQDVGLVYKEILQLSYCTDDPCLGQQQIVNGIEMEMVFREYGKR